MPKSRHRKKKSRPTHSGRDERIATMRRVAHYPLRECRINDNWDEQRMASVTIARDCPDGDIAIGGFVVDLGCLGVKDAFANPRLSLFDYQQRIVHGSQTNQVVFDPACAVKLIRGAIEYARKLDFKAHPDYYYSREIFGDINPEVCQETFEYGREGKPFYVAGPYDNAIRIVNQLNRKLGPGGFDYIVFTGPADFFDGDEDFDEEVEEEDEAEDEDHESDTGDAANPTVEVSPQKRSLFDRLRGRK